MNRLHIAQHKNVINTEQVMPSPKVKNKLHSSKDQNILGPKLIPRKAEDYIFIKKSFIFPAVCLTNLSKIRLYLSDSVTSIFLKLQ